MNCSYTYIFLFVFIIAFITPYKYSINGIQRLKFDIIIILHVTKQMHKIIGLMSALQT